MRLLSRLLSRSGGVLAAGRDNSLTLLTSVRIIRPRLDVYRTLGCYGRSIEGSYVAP